MNNSISIVIPSFNESKNINEIYRRTISTIKKIYNQINLGDFETIEPKIKSYLSTVKNYKKNTFSILTEKETQSINERWEFSFNEWKYPINKIN